MLHFSLDNTYFEYNNTFYKQVTGGPMGSPPTETLAEIRVTDIENLAISTFPHPPKHYRHFVDDGFGHFTDRDHANNFLQHINSLTEDLQYTIEHPSSDGSIPFLDVLIHPDRSTSIYRKPTHTNLHIHYSSSSPTSTKFPIISSLTRRAYTLCSSCHLNDELQFLKHTFLTNGFPSTKSTKLWTGRRNHYRRQQRRRIRHLQRRLSYLFTLHTARRSRQPYNATTLRRLYHLFLTTLFDDRTQHQQDAWT